MSVQFNQRRDEICEKFAHPENELWYRCDGIRAVISTCYRLRPALFSFGTGRLLAVGEPVGAIVRSAHGPCMPTYRVWTGDRYVGLPADSILYRAMQYSSVPVELPEEGAMMQRPAAKTPKPAAKRRKAPGRRAEIRIRYNDEMRRIAGGTPLRQPNDKP